MFLGPDLAYNTRKGFEAMRPQRAMKRAIF